MPARTRPCWTKLAACPNMRFASLSRKPSASQEAKGSCVPCADTIGGCLRRALPRAFGVFRRAESDRASRDQQKTSVRNWRRSRVERERERERRERERRERERERVCVSRVRSLARASWPIRTCGGVLRSLGPHERVGPIVVIPKVASHPFSKINGI